MARQQATITAIVSAAATALGSVAIAMRHELIGRCPTPDTALTLFWPPARRSAPVLASCFLFVVGICVSSFMKNRSTNAQRELHKIKAKRAMAQITQALRWDKDDDPKEPTEDGDENKEKRPPECKELFEMLYDEIEERHVTDYGIAKDDEDYVGALELFKTTVPSALAEATRCTRIARGLATAEDRAHDDCSKRVALFKDGHRLRELLQLYEGKGNGRVSIVKAFGGHLAPKKVIDAARACQNMVDHKQMQDGKHVLLSLLRPHLPLYALSAALMAFDSAVGAATWHAVATLLDGIDSGTMTLDELSSVFLQTFAKLCLCIFSHMASCFMTEKVAGRFGDAVKSEVLRGILRKDTFFFDVYPCGVIQERLNHDANDLTSKCFHLPLGILHMSLMVISNSIAVYHIRPELLMICIAPIPLVAFMQKFFVKHMNRMHKRGRKIAEHVVANTNEMIKEMRTVRSFAMEADEAKLYDAQGEYRTQIIESTSIIHHCLFISPLVMMFVATRLFATYNGGSFVAAKLITVGAAVQVGAAADHLQHCVRMVLEQLPEIFKIFGPIGRICDAISTRPLIEPYPGCPAKLMPEKLEGRIEFRDVDFTFPSEPQKQILHGLSFSAAPGEKVGLVGSTGCGKSTTISLIQRFYDPTSGLLLLDGRPISDYDVHYVRRQISVVAQDSVLFSTTIRENIMYGLTKEQQQSLSNEALEDACRQANALEFISGFPRCFETFCGERGVKLSGGQKQRLAIARAIIRNPTICLLDEATSALDSKAEGVVQAAIDTMISQKAKGCTLMIAHRLSTIKNCDRILCLDKGRVLEQGTHEELLSMDIVQDSAGKTVAGLYNDLWTTQMGSRESNDTCSAMAAKEAATVNDALAAARKRIIELEIESGDLRKKLAAVERTPLESINLSTSTSTSSLNETSAESGSDDANQENCVGNSVARPCTPTRAALQDVASQRRSRSAPAT